MASVLMTTWHDWCLEANRWCVNPLSPPLRCILNEIRDNEQIHRRSNNSALEAPCRWEDADEQTRRPVYDDLGMLSQHLRAFACEPAPLLDLSSLHLEPLPLLPWQPVRTEAGSPQFLSELLSMGALPWALSVHFPGALKPLIQQALPLCLLYVLRPFYPHHCYWWSLGFELNKTEDHKPGPDAHQQSPHSPLFTVTRWLRPSSYFFQINMLTMGQWHGVPRECFSQ